MIDALPYHLKLSEHASVVGTNNLCFHYYYFFYFDKIVGIVVRGS